MKSKPTDITIKFDSEEAAEHFAVWLCESGEQSYWEWMEYREQEEEGDITAVQFHYHGEWKEDDELEPEEEDDNEEDSSNGFMCDWTIRTTTGRLDK